LIDRAQIMLRAPATSDAGIRLMGQAQELIKSPTYMGIDGHIYPKPGQVQANEQLAFGTQFGTSLAQQPFEIQRAQLNAQLDAWKTDLAQRGAARYEMVPYRDPASGQTFQIPKEQAVDLIQRQLRTLDAQQAQARGTTQPPPGAPPPALGGPSTPGVAGGPTAAPGGGAPLFPVGIPGAPELTPEQQAHSKGLGDIDAEITANSQKADTTLQRLVAIENSVPNFRTGALGSERLAFNKYILGALQSLPGFDDPDLIKSLQTYAASGELIDKEAGFMATELARGMGSREAASVVNMVRGFMPNLNMSNGGFRYIVRSLAAGAQRDKDIAAFRDQWLADPSHGGSITGMMSAFNQLRPVEYYASHVIPFPAPMANGKLVTDRLIPDVLYRNGAGDVAVWNGSTMVPVSAGGP
jgi:hypothetical protein